MLWFATPVAGMMIRFMTAGRLSWMIVLGAFIGVSYFADRWALSSTSLGKQYAGLGLYVLAESFLFVPLIAMAWLLGTHGEPGLLSKAVMITLAMFGSLTGIVFVTRKDFSFLRGILMFGGLAAFGLIGMLTAVRLHAGAVLQLRDDRLLVRLYPVRHVQCDVALPHQPACGRVARTVRVGDAVVLVRAARADRQAALRSAAPTVRT